ncbi:MAG: multidrug DMT transporter permease [Bacteroidales bacterium]|nr:multidrug DMT transporter permease [Candidatus Cryptobacteroides aphodequi]
MFIANSQFLAVILCIITMLCWGSWGNTQKLAAKSWRYELFYWDYVIGMVLFSLIMAFTLGSFGKEGVPFIANLAQANFTSIAWVLAGAVVFAISNILLSASTAKAGMSVAFPLGVGLALVVGVINNLIFHPNEKTNVVLLLIGVALVVAAIICNGVASGKVDSSERDPRQNRQGLVYAVLAGLIMSFFSALVYNGVDINNFAAPTAGMLTPYSGLVIFSLGVFACNFLFNGIFALNDPSQPGVNFADYFKGDCKTHLVGMLGGAIWCLGTGLNYVSAGTAGAAVSYALGQGAPLVAAIWGVFIWKEFKGAKKGVNVLLGLMFVLFVAGLATIIAAGN